MFFLLQQEKSQPYVCFSWIIASKSNHMTKVELLCFNRRGGSA